MRISHKKYDVFISFMGEDTGTNFTAQLHRALTNKNIESCIDYNLGKGDEVEAALTKAIQDSRMSIVVFSENYATSKWCLDELLHILQCRELHGQVVIPVFCNIDPSHVRRQTGSYEMAFARYERQLANSKSHLDKVSEWKAALSLAASTSGWDARKYRDDSQAIEHIVEDVSQKLSHMYPTELEDLVKVDENSEHIELLLKTIQRIGIWGMSGIGKTTIAKQMFAKNFAHYDNVCFLEKVGEESRKFGPLYVRKKLLSELVKREITASDVHGLPTFIKRRLSGKKSFIVLDDVDNATQLDYLCGVLDDLGPNSRLIITTRDRHALSGKVDEIYEVKTWKPKDSLKLFSIRAFNQDHPLKGYERVSERVVECAGGVPLALEVLGSYFHSKKPEFWESELNLYENKGEAFPDIQKVLRASFNALSWQQKEMFLDIAFFFKGENKDFVTRILNAFGFNATSEIEILEDKALITISNNSRIQMHDLRQKMAFDIVREEYSDRGTCSRLRDAKDICDVLGKNKGSDAIEGIIFDLSQKIDVHVQADTFNLMTKLKFLKFHIPSGKKKLGTVHLPENIMPFFKKLTYLEWNGYPLKSLPQPFCAEQLIQICLPHSNIKYLWYGMQELVNLEAIDLSECKQLRNLPDLSGALKLKQLRLSGCDSLREVQPSAFSKDTLDTLLLDRCTKLQSLKGEKHLTSLVNFSVKGCKSLKEFSLSSDSIKRLDLSKTGIEILYPSIGDMNKLSWLNLEGLNLKNLPIALSRLRSLTELRVSKCSIVTKSKLEALFDGLRSLTLLHLKDCCNLFELPANISSLSSLYELRLDGSSVEELPASIKFLSELEVQSIDNCSKLRCLPVLPLSIKEFQADNCTSLTTVSTLKTFSKKMIGKKKHISFKNSIKMELDGPSLDRITEDAILTMKSAAFHNVFLRKDKYTAYDFGYNSAEVCLPGRGVPIQFKHRSATHSSLTIDISNSLGFILSVVVSPSNRTQQREYYWFDMECQCYTEHGKSIAVYKSSWNNKLITDHVFILYDPYHSDAILTRFERNVSFEFFITTYTSSGREQGLLSIKECGVCPIYYSESQKVLGSWNLDKDAESELYEGENCNMRISHKQYDVFISFRGEDTRTNFTAQLHRALSDKNIDSYIDYSLVKGDEVGPALAKAIQDSHMSVIVFSENYATSKWCLDELLHILQCRKHHGQVVIPVFYNIDPSHVRHQKESYEMAFARYERDLANSKSQLDKVSEWKAALKLAANISGWDSRKYRDDSQVIDRIVEDVLQKLSLMYPNELKNLVKVDENSEHIELLLKTKPRIGIWGMSGIGKTTIAKQMFAKNFAHYDNVCFLEKVSEQLEKSGPINVRNQLLRELLKRKITASDVHGLHTFIQRRLFGKKVFIVLDDVDNATQLDDLCRLLGDLGPNSRLIITTRDRHTLSGKVDWIYEVKTWRLKDSLKLFSMRAFKQDHPLKGYERLSERAVECAGGVPLALEVLGSHFYSRRLEFWESELNLYENKGESLPDIQKVLRASYNGLSWRQREMFLDIAFFFKGENKDFVTRILDAFGFNATSGIEILEDRALITISNNSRIQMHDLLQKMAFDIVREEYNDGGKRSRRRDTKDICDVLGNNKGNDAIEGIIFDLSQKLDIHVQADTFKLMTKLRFLKFHIPKGKKKLGTVHLPENIMPFFDKLTYLEWNGYPLKSLPEPFHAEQLIQISLPHSNIEHLWYGMQELVNLEALNLSECKQLRHLPDLSGALKLKQLCLSGCEELREVQPSAFSKDTLDTLLLDRCIKLESLMGEKHLTSLKNFSVKGCSSLKEFSLSSDSIVRLDLSKTGIKILYPSIGDMNNLISLNLEDLNLTNLPIELSCLRSLTELRVSKCRVVTKSMLEALFEGLTLLRLLHLKDCCNLIELPANISSLESLHELRLDGSSVEELPASIKYLSELEILSLDNCSKLRCLPELPLSIKEFQADNCTSLITVSTLKTFSKNMIGQKKYISFKNSIMLELDGPSLDRITEDAMLTMKSAAFHNVLVRKYRFQTHSFNYNRAEVCLPGRRVPREFKHRSTTSPSITINISNSLGFIFAVVVSPSKRTRKHGYFVGMRCQCYTEDGSREVGYKSKWDHKLITNLNMDHVFVWYDPYHSDSILSSIDKKISFEFCITTYTSSGRELGGLLSIKECGVCPICYSESQMVLGTGNLDKDLELELYEEIQFESRSREGYDEEEGTGIQNQQSDLNDNCHSSYECLIVSNDSQVHENPQEKENFDDNKNMMKFNIVHESSEKSGDNSTGGSSDVELSFIKANKRDESSVDDELHSSISPTRLNSTDKSKTDEETKNLQQSPPPLVKYLQIPSYSYTNKLNPNTSMAAESSSSKPSSSKDSEYSPIDYSEYKRVLEEDPLAIMDKLLSGELGHSSQASQSTSQSEATETQSESIKMLLDELRELAFSRNLLKHLPNDVTLGEEVKALLVKLNYRANELSEKQSSGITDFTKIFIDATLNIDEEKLSNVTLQHLNVDHEDSISKLQASKDNIMKFDESISTAEDKIKARDVEIDNIKAQIHFLEEKARKLQQEKSQLEDACSKCKEKRIEIVEEAKNVAFVTIQTREKIDNVNKKKRELDSNYDTLEGNYAIMRLSPPF